MPVALGMHYGKPSIKNALDELRQKKVTKIVILPLYPHYSATTTASAFDRIAKALQTERRIPAIRMISDYADDACYIKSLCQFIRAAWQEQGRADCLLFSFHGIPKKYVAAGDPYRERCETTVRLVAQELQLNPTEYRLSFQSRLGRAEWLQPYTEKTLQELSQQGITRLQVICPGFAVDCLETLEEIMIRGKKEFLAKGGKVFHYIPALNDSEAHVNVLENMIKKSVADWVEANGANLT